MIFFKFLYFEYVITKVKSIIDSVIKHTSLIEFIINTHSLKNKSQNEQKTNSKAFLRQHILQTAADFGGAGEWAFLLNVEVVGQREGKPIRIVSNTSHSRNAEWGTTATARMTGIPASIGAQKLARGEAKQKGVIAPEACFEPKSFFEELAKRGIRADSEEAVAN